MSNNTKRAGVAMVATAAALFMAGCASPGGGSGEASTAKVMCAGVNACKGQSDCKTANNGCKGQNACKGQGVVQISKEACTQQGGRV